MIYFCMCDNNSEIKSDPKTPTVELKRCLYKIFLFYKTNMDVV